MESLSACLRFAVLVTSDREPRACVICESPKESHALSGIRLLRIQDVLNEQGALNKAAGQESVRLR